MTAYTCRVSHLDEGERALERQAREFLGDMEEAGVVRAERVLALVEAIERRVAEARAYVVSVAKELEARLKAQSESSAYKALEARVALGGLKEA